MANLRGGIPRGASAALFSERIRESSVGLPSSNSPPGETGPAAIKKTSLKLLTRDGALAATFTPALSAEQYDELAAAVNQFHGKPDLRQYLSEVASRWRVSVVIDD
jgi:hypothetical protein